MEGDAHRLSSPLTLQQLRLLEMEFKRHGQSLDEETFRDLVEVIRFAETILLKGLSKKWPEESTGA